jgi:hypothetical protein
MLREVAPGVHVMEAKQRFVGLEVGARMTVLQLEAGVLVHSPVAVNPRVVQHLGQPRWVVAPNLLHHLHVGPWLEAGAQAWGVEGLPRKRPDLPFHATLDERGTPFGPELLVLPLRCFALTNEVVLLHRPSATLIVTDLLYNLSNSAPWPTRWAFRCLGGYPGCQTTLLERVGMDRDVARREIAMLRQLPFDRIIMSHGELVETGGREALARAFRWLG